MVYLYYDIHLKYLCFELFCLFVFFFQAEDGIRDRTVTGVQTCALPILYLSESPASLSFANYSAEKNITTTGLTPTRISISGLGIDLPVYQATIVNNVWPTTTKGASYLRSEERRVGKECRYMWRDDAYKR